MEITAKEIKKFCLVLRDRAKTASYSTDDGEVKRKYKDHTAANILNAIADALEILQ